MMLINTNNPVMATVNCDSACIAQPSPVACAQTCIENITMLSSECSACYANDADCMFVNCFGACNPEPSSQVCQMCRVTSGCGQQFFDCAGV